jgi:hypothetical protein
MRISKDAESEIVMKIPMWGRVIAWPNCTTFADYIHIRELHKILDTYLDL